VINIVVTVPWGERLGGAENMLWTFLRHADRSRIRTLVVFFQEGPFRAEISALRIPAVSSTGWATSPCQDGRDRRPLARRPSSAGTARSRSQLDRQGAGLRMVDGGRRSPAR
jgi:hypothetical protein